MAPSFLRSHRPGSANSSSAATSSNASKRLSRLSPSDFDELLKAGDTKRVAVAGVIGEEQDEDEYRGLPESPVKSTSGAGHGHVRRKESISQLPLTAAPASANVAATQEQQQELDPTKRRSMFRSVGTASSPDLATLVRKQKEQFALASGSSSSAAAAPAELPSTPERGSSLSPRKTRPATADSPPAPSSQPATAPLTPRTLRTRTLAGAAGAAQPGGSGSRPGSAHSASNVPPPRTPPQLLAPTSSQMGRQPSGGAKHPPRVSDISFSSSGSYVDLGDLSFSSAAPGPQYEDSPPAPSRAGYYASGAGVGFTASSVSVGKEGRGDEKEGKGWGGTMRKTSRFFRMLGGGSGSGANSSSSGGARTTASAPTTPISSVFSHHASLLATPPPPVPSVPKNYLDQANATANGPNGKLPSSPSAGSQGSQGSLGRMTLAAMARASEEADASRSRSDELNKPQAINQYAQLAAAARQHSASEEVEETLQSPVNAAAAAAEKDKEEPYPESDNESLRNELANWQAIDSLRHRGSLDSSRGSTAVPPVLVAPAQGGRPVSLPPPASPKLQQQPQSRQRTPEKAAAKVASREALFQGEVKVDKPKDVATLVASPVKRREKPLLSDPFKESSALPAVPLAKKKTRESFDDNNTFPSIRVVRRGSNGGGESDSDLSSAPNSRRPSASGSATPPPAIPARRGSVERPSFESITTATGAGAGRRGSASSQGTAGELTRRPSLPSVREVESPEVVPALPTSSSAGVNGTPVNGRKDETTPTKSTAASEKPYPTYSPSGGSYPSAIPLVFTHATPGSADEKARKRAQRQSMVAYPSSSLGSPSVSRASISSEAGLTMAARGGGDKFLAGLPDEEKESKAAAACFDEDEAFLPRPKIAEWLGSKGKVNEGALRLYMDNFAFAGLRIDSAFRRLCDKLYFKAESQQLDRILKEFSRKWVEDNPTSFWQKQETVHTVSFSLMLLNTDLHVADVPKRMTRAEYLANTAGALAMLNGPSSSGASEHAALQKLAGGKAGALASRNASKMSLDRIPEQQVQAGLDPHSANGSPEMGGSTPNLLGTKAKSRAGSVAEGTQTPPALTQEMEAALKDMYDSLKAQPVLQPTSSSLALPGSSTPNAGNSPYGSSPGVSRSISRRSATSQSTNSSTSMAYKRSSIRGFGSFLGTTSSSSEFTRAASPSPSTTTSLSDDLFSTAYGAHGHGHGGPPSIYAPSIGFVSTLRDQAILREEAEDALAAGSEETAMSDEELALLGAPWAKEGLLQRKHYWEASGRRAKEKNWIQTFVVVSKGDFGMYKFGDTTGARSGGIGGGNWASNASSMGTISLVHALCSAMPGAGYNKDRPHCFVLTLPTGGSFFFQAGTADLVAEWVSTCNYWAARLSKEPLSGGVSNMEYGWNRVGLEDDEHEDVRSVRSGKSNRSNFTSHTRISYQRSMMSLTGGAHAGAGKTGNINEWNPPQVPDGKSTLPEEVQHERLKRHVDVLKDELVDHNSLRGPMMKLYLPNTPNYVKALSNWERKSKHLLSEIVKYQTYIEALAKAIEMRVKHVGEREVEIMLAAADEELDEDDDDGIDPTADYSEAERRSATPTGPRLSIRTPVDSAKRKMYYSSLDSPASMTSEGDVFFEANGTS